MGAAPTTASEYSVVTWVAFSFATSLKRSMKLYSTFSFGMFFSWFLVGFLVGFWLVFGWFWLVLIGFWLICTSIPS